MRRERRAVMGDARGAGPGPGRASGVLLLQGRARNAFLHGDGGRALSGTLSSALHSHR